MEECLFCNIINGKIPTNTIYEDEVVKVFMDISPVNEGHLLIIPKKHYQNLFDVDKDTLLTMIQVIQEKLYPLLKEKLNIDGLTISQNNDYGQEIKHFHIHVIPRYQNDSFPLTNPNMASLDTIYEKLTRTN